MHIIVTGEDGRAKFFVVSKPRLKTTLTIFSLVFIVSCIAGIRFSYENIKLDQKVAYLKQNLNNTAAENRGLREQVVSLEEKNREQLNGAYGQLNQRSKLIDSILSTLEISPEDFLERNGSQGGPFTSIDEETTDKLIFKVDRTLKTLQPLPLGYPITGRITSSFGKRVDPLNSRTAFHDGIDIVNRQGSEIKATADGIVVECGYNGTYGWYVKLDHGNSFISMYAHNKKLLVKKGDIIMRGQIVSYLGNTGRSTGPHLHYEIRYKNKPINPIKFMRIAKYIHSGEEG